MKVEEKITLNSCFLQGCDFYLGSLKPIFVPYGAWVFLQLLLLAFFFFLVTDTHGVFAESGARRGPRERGHIFGRGHS